jgi:tetraacyldisaccharide 4'-kinase
MASTSGIVLGPVGALYGMLMRARLALYRRGAMQVHRLGAPVISVGNITTGGTGKTPLVEWLARELARAHRRPCILTRGYGRADAGARVLVSDGERVLADAERGGDEPCLLAEKLLGMAAVISDADRVAAAAWALENLHPDLFILDDGFQHLRVARDLNIATVDATNPWGGGRLLPFGRLREPVRGLARADCIVVTRAEQTTDINALREQLASRSNSRPVFLSRVQTSGLRPLSTRALNAEGMSPATLLSASSVASNVAAFCALGNPQAFFTHLGNEGFTLKVARAFPDHHVYSQHDILAVEQEARARGAEALLTTAKDGVKLRALGFRLPCYIVEIELSFDEEAAFRQLLMQALER